MHNKPGLEILKRKAIRFLIPNLLSFSARVCRSHNQLLSTLVQAGYKTTHAWINTVKLNLISVLPY